MFAKLRSLDFYRYVPKELTESSTHGTVMSIVAAIFMLSLFIAEMWAFLSTQMVSNVVIDSVMDPMLRINFNITVLDMPCEFATLSVVDVLGTRNENLTKNINKWQVDENGIRQNYEGRNLVQRDIDHDMHHDLEALHSNGIHAVPVDESSFDGWIGQHQYTFVNFYAPWCIWCQRLEPVWEALAERVEADGIPVSVIKVDCVANHNLCMNQRIQAFPSLRLFKSGRIQPPDYRSDRTVEAFVEFIKSRLSLEEQLQHLDPVTREEHKDRILKDKDDHPGCMIAGFLLVNRVPGNFHIEAQSKHHNLNPALSNMSHVVNHLSFGPVLSKSAMRRLNDVDPNFFDMDSTQPMNGNGYVNFKLHQAFHHYIKVVSTRLDLGGRFSGSDALQTYQIVQSSQIMQYQDTEVPEARFSYDLSPMSILVSVKGRRWYEFLTSICAIIGGTFTVLGLVSGVLNSIFKSKKL